MPYDIVDIELTQPLPLLRLDHHDGIAFILRRKDRVIGFFMEPAKAGNHLNPDDLAILIARRVGTQLIQERLRDELAWSVTAPGFPSLTVAICTRDRPRALRRCLQSILDPLSQTTNGRDGISVLVVDNAPTDARTKQVVACFRSVRYVTEAKPGLNFARNRAMREAEGELIAYLDDDVAVDGAWLRGLQEAWSENPDAAAFTGQVLPLSLETEAQILFEKRGGFRHGFNKIRYGSSAPREDGYLYPCRTGIFGVGCNMAFRRQLLLEIGGFDEALDTGKPLPGGGDHDIFYRVIRHGHVLVYEPAYLVYHEHRQTMEQLTRQYWSWGQSVMAFASKIRREDRPLRTRWRKLIIAWFLAHIRETVQALLGRHVLPARLVWWEFCGGIVGCCGEYERSKRRVQRICRKYR